MRRSTKWWLLGGSIGAAVGFASAYGVVMRPWHLRWGATDEEVGRAMPLDDLVVEPNFFTTRAVTIAAGPDEVWPFVNDLSSLPAGTTIRHVEEKKWIAFVPPEPVAEATWVVLLEPKEPGMTRLIARNRAHFGSTLTSIFRYLLVDPGQFLIERNWLIGIKARAEELARAVRHDVAIELEDDVPAKLEPAE